MRSATPIERQRDEDLEGRLRELRQRAPGSREAADEERAIENELAIRRRDRARRDRKQREARRPAEPTPSVEVAPDPSTPEGRRDELERERARLALGHERSPDAGVLKQLQRVEAELAEADRAIERHELAQREEARVTAEDADARAAAEQRTSEQRAVRLVRKRQRLAAKIERATDDLVTLLREDELLRDRVASVRGGFVDRDPLVSWLQGRLHELYPVDFPGVHDHYRGQLTGLVG